MTNLVTLSGLKEWTLYCVAVRTLNNNVWKESSFTPPLCVQTEGELKAPPSASSLVKALIM